MRRAAQEKYPQIRWGGFDEDMVVSRLSVIKSAAGYYVGRYFAYEEKDGEIVLGFYERESGYFSKERAKEELASMLQ